MKKNKDKEIKDDRKLMRTKNGKLILAPGTEIQASDRQYYVAPDGSWRRLYKKKKK